MVSYTPEQRVRVPGLKADWLTQTFVHWPYAPDDVAPLLPEGLVVEEFDGAAWVSFTPFVMTRVRPPWLPSATPGLPTFPETNLRTYVRCRDGRDGLWFLSIEVDCAVMLAARVVGAPYHLGRLDVTRSAGAVRYTGSRRGGGPWYGLTVRPGEPLRPTRRDVWLTSRWRAYTSRLGSIWQTPVEHEPWHLREATLEDLRETLTRAAGLPAPPTDPVVHFSDGARRVRIGVSLPVRPAGPVGSVP